ncbi:BMP family ABC transporter substrate-binding protein [Aquibium carbonis]|uniref:BMP family ABC transporter substrate-binding protein n=1 Tax=Aquibium carbonis TaxID=2495581 RepID=A0A429YUB4_9HYPH|nr:BMP family protein [Aquibium carbonis]RST85047.1 BMP family ABC transporter substrate-binding protein [Aquibium carbonis]
MTTNLIKRGVLAAVTAVFMAGTAIAADVKSIAIMTPEEGTDFGWNQQGVDAAKAAAEAAGIEVIVASGLGYGDVRPALREIAADGASLIIAHASGYATSAPEIAEETSVPVAIVDSPQALKAGLVADYTLSGHEGAYLAGRMAAKMSRSKHVGIVVSGEPPSWNSQSAGFAQGVKAENPEVKITYAVIGPAAYSDAAGGRRVTESVIAAGADIIFGQGNGSSFGMLQAVETTAAADGGKVLFIDVIGDKTSVGKGFLLSSVVWDITPVYAAMIKDLQDDTFGTKRYAIGLADDSVKLLKTDEIPDDVWTDVQAIREQMLSGEITIEPVFEATAVRALMTDVSAAAQ